MGGCSSRSQPPAGSEKKFEKIIKRMDNLPPEMILTIMKYLAGQDLANFASASPRYTEVCNSNQKIVKKLNLRIKRLYDFQLLQETALDYRQITVSFDPTEPIIELTDFNRLKRIDILNIDYFNIYPQKLNLLLRACPGLKELRTSYPYIHRNFAENLEEDTTNIILFELKKLETLVIEEFSLTHTKYRKLLRNKTIKKLTVIGEFAEAHPVAKLLKHLPELVEVKFISEATVLIEEMMELAEAIVSYNEKLESAKFVHNSAEDISEQFIAIIEHEQF